MDQIVNRPELTGNHRLRRVVNPLPVHEELVLVLSLREVQDGHEVIMALNQWDLGAPVVEGAGDEDRLAAFGPADHGGPRLLSGPGGVLQVLLPRYELFVPGELVSNFSRVSLTSDIISLCEGNVFSPKQKNQKLKCKEQ